MNYSLLNDVIKEFLDDSNLKLYLDNLDEVVRLANIIVENYYDTDILTYDDDILLSQSVNISRNFFLTISDEYSKKFDELLSSNDIYNGVLDNIVSFFKVPKKLTYQFNRSGVDEDGRVFIDYNETLEDIFNIVHEFTHRFSFIKNNNSSLKKFFGETPTILSEFLLEEYLLDNGSFSKEEILKHKINRFKGVYDDSLAIIVQSILINLYRQNGFVNEEILLNYLDSLDKSSKLYEILCTKSVSLIKEIIKREGIDFYNRQRYIIGLFCALNMMNDKNIINFKILVEVLKNDDSTTLVDQEKLRQFIPIIGCDRLLIDDSIINSLTILFNDEKNSFDNYSRRKI